jgi:hypothetical protein
VSGLGSRSRTGRKVFLSLKNLGSYSGQGDISPWLALVPYLPVRVLMTEKESTYALSHNSHKI